MYNAYLSDPNIDRCSVIIRQICCHPKIADEIKGVLSNCKTLQILKNLWCRIYKYQYMQANNQVKKCELLIAKTERRILITDI